MLAAIGGVSGHGWSPPPTGGPPQMNEVAKLLGLSSSELSSELGSGKTLSTLASEKGVSSSELVKTIETELSAHKPEGAPELSASELTKMATSIANGTPPAPPSSLQQGSGSGGHSNATTLAQSLGIEPSELLEGIEKGLDLGSLLGQSGYTNEGTSSQQLETSGVAFNEYA